MLLTCLDSSASGTLKRKIIEKEDISLTGIGCYNYLSTKTTLYGSRAHVKSPGAPKSVDGAAATLCPSISELRVRHSQRQMAPQLPRSPDLSKSQVSGCH